MKTATFLFFACLLVNVSLQFEYSTLFHDWWSERGRKGKAMYNSRLDFWKNCFLSRHKAILSDPHNSRHENVLAVNLGDFDGVGEDGDLNLNLRNLTVLVNDQFEIPFGQLEVWDSNPNFGRLMPEIRLNISFETSYDATYHFDQPRTARRDKFVGDIIVRASAIVILYLNGSSVDGKSLPKLDSVEIYATSFFDWKKSLSTGVTIQGRSNHILDMMALIRSIVDRNDTARFRTKIDERLEAKVTAKLQAAWEAEKSSPVCTGGPLDE